MRIKNFFESKFYNITITILALIVVITFFIETTVSLNSNFIRTFEFLNNIIYIIFVLDYFTRLFISNRKKEFVLSNKIDLISILPFNSMFRGLRIARVAKILKFTKFIRALAFTANY